jgi:hypothetical protein
MNKAALQQGLRRARTEMARLIGAVGRERMDIAGVSGRMSMKDVLAHVNAYQRALVTWLDEAKDGRVYVDPVLDRPDLDARNAIMYEANRERSGEDVIASFENTLRDLEARVAALSDKELTDAESTAWFVEPRWQRVQPLAQCIANDSFEHHEEHVPDIQRWLREHGS